MIRSIKMATACALVMGGLAVSGCANTGWDNMSNTQKGAILGTLGMKPGNPDKQRYFWRSPTGVFGITKPIDGQSARHANGGTIGFACESPEQVQAWHAAGVANGGTAQRREVRVGLAGVGKVEIVEGLAEGDQAILPASGALDGDKVRIRPPKSPRVGGLQVPQGMTK